METSRLYKYTVPDSPQVCEEVERLEWGHWGNAMCSNYQPVTRSDRLLAYFGVERARDEPPHDVFPLGLAPFIRKAPTGEGRVAEDGCFGLVPHFRKELQFGRRTYNARSETVAQLPSFRTSWKKGMRCIVPAEAIYEPNYESGKSVRWRIALPNHTPMGIAGIYWPWRAPDGRELFTFAMLTVNADGHPVMQRFHRPEDEKRMVVILHPEDYDRWLACDVEEAAGFLKRWEGVLEASPQPLPPRAPRAVSGKVVRPPEGPERGESGGLFD
jgi:putative SOS response-associated peptidase YedK